jgi:hypothetical protein
MCFWWDLVCKSTFVLHLLHCTISWSLQVAPVVSSLLPGASEYKCIFLSHSLLPSPVISGCCFGRRILGVGSGQTIPSLFFIVFNNYMNWKYYTIKLQHMKCLLSVFMFHILYKSGSPCWEEHTSIDNMVQDSLCFPWNVRTQMHTLYFLIYVSMRKYCYCVGGKNQTWDFDGFAHFQRSLVQKRGFGNALTCVPMHARWTDFIYVRC